MVNPRITIETLLERIKPSDIANIEKQLKSVSSSVKKSSGELGRSDLLKVPVQQLEKLNRSQKAYAANVRIATRQVDSWREAMKLGSIVIRDMFTKVGALNAALNILIS